MDKESLASFSRQIAEWINELLEHGRFPFRKISIAPSVVTPAGNMQPDLVLWINQPSCMAGGVIFMPLKEETFLFEDYAVTASCLGLKYFTVWGSRSIVIHSTCPPYQQHARLELKDNPSPFDFRDSLRTLLEKLKLLAVTGAVLPHELTAWHLVNLCLMTVTEAQASILETTRRHRDEQPMLTPELLSRELCWHTLFQLLALITFDLLPETVHAERLEKALDIATESLPEPLKNCPPPAQHPLPEAASIAFHHLFRRLTQLGWRNNLQRLKDTLAKLLDYSASTALQLPCDIQTGHPLLCDPVHLDQPNRCSLIATPGRLPGLLLERELQELSPPVFACTSPFQLPLGQEPMLDGIYGVLSGTSFQVMESLDDLLVYIRASWPNRRFQLPRRPARWALELLHLLGTCTPGAEVHLDTPRDWPRDPDAQFLTRILAESFAAGEMTQHPEGLLLELRRGPSQEYLTLHLSAEKSRKLEVHWLVSSPETALAMALYLPDDIWGLVLRGELAFRDITLIPAKNHPGLIRFLESAWGQLLMTSCGRKTPKTLGPDSVHKLAGSLLLPPTALLDQLSSDEYLDDTSGRVESDIAQWLGVQAPRMATLPTAHDTAPKRIRQKEKQRLLNTVFVDGVPIFPEHYLYDYYQPEKKSYHLPGPLSFQRRFFNQVELVHRGGRQIVVDNDLTAHALLLLSHGDLDRVELPVSEEILADIIQRYLDDLASLKENLIEQCNHVSDTAEKARSLARKLWRQQGLPPWELLKRNF